MLINRLQISYVRGILVGLLPIFALIVMQIAAAKTVTLPDHPVDSTGSEVATSYQWNIGDKELPLIGLSAARLNVGFDQSLGYPTGKFDLAITRSLNFDEDGGGRYLLPTLTKEKAVAFIELTRTGTPGTYMSIEGLQLVEKSGMKIVKTFDGTSYTFTQYPDGELRCSTIKQVNGPTLFLLYTANGLMLHGMSDSTGRSVTFNYGKNGIQSLTQTWMTNLEGFTKTWSVGDDNSEDNSVKYAHAVGVKSAKFLPSNAVIRAYTSEMADCDRLLARIFGGP